MTLQQRLAAAREALVRAGILPENAAIDVELYARTILGWDRAQLLTRQLDPVPEGLEPLFSEWLARRERHEPSAYIVGHREFWGLEFQVTPAVLIPRPETELIVEEVLAIVGAGSRATGRAALSATAAATGRSAAADVTSAEPPGTGLRIADIGTGSGCIAVALAHELPGATVVATDVSGRAIDVARENAVRHGVAERMQFVTTSYLDGVDGPFDVITANPPYVRDVDKRALSHDVLHEPDVALFGGPDGLHHIDQVMHAAADTLRPGGWFVMEFGFGQQDDVAALVERHPALRLDHLRADLQGLARTAIMQRS